MPDGRRDRGLVTRRTGSVTIGRRSVGVSGFLLGATGYVAAIYVHSAGSRDRFPDAGQWSARPDASRAVGYYYRCRRRIWGTAAGFVTLPRACPQCWPHCPPRWLETDVRIFHAVFFAAAAMYLFGRRALANHRSAKIVIRVKDPNNDP